MCSSLPFAQAELLIVDHGLTVKISGKYEKIIKKIQFQFPFLLQKGYFWIAPVIA